MHPGVDQEIDDLGETIVIDTVVIPVRSYHRGINTFKFHHWRPGLLVDRRHFEGERVGFDKIFD